MPLVFSLNYRVLILALLLLPVLLWLGQWQLRRAVEKEAIQARYDLRLSQAPVTWESLNLDGDLSYLQVSLRGSFDKQRWFLLDNRIQAGQVGYEVLAPFLLENGEWVIVNRGWVKAPAKRSDLPHVPVPLDHLSLTAQIYVPPQGYQLAGIESTADWPMVITVFDRDFLSQQLGVDLFPYQLRLKAGQPGALGIDWPPINVSPAKHRAYAFQWFAMAAALVLWLLVVSLRKNA